jgi:enoyl-CoA hydratase/carnithine racemase
MEGCVTDLVTATRQGRVLVISMQREAKRNAINRQLAEQLDHALNMLEDEADLWVGVLTGTASVFSAGSDVAAQDQLSTARGGDYGIIRRDHRKPLIAAVEGIAFGGGMEIVLACDLVVAARTAKFGLPEVRLGLVPTCAGLFRAPRALPVNLARELILTGQAIDAERAFGAGLVNILSEPGGALKAALVLAERICENAPLAVQACLHAVNTVIGSNDPEGWGATSDAIASMAGSQDAQEGVRAFLEKRRPVWTGH